jgi:carbamoyltransferase
MAAVLGINAVFHDSSAALVHHGLIAGALEEERISRRKHAKVCVPFSAWELPEHSARWCVQHAGLDPSEIDAVAYSYDPALSPPSADVTSQEWEGLRTLYAHRFPNFMQTALPGIERARVHYVPHHVAHAASAYLAAPFEECAVLVLDGRGECASGLLGVARGGELEVLHRQLLPDSLGLLYEELTAHLGFMRSSDEYKVMGLAAHGRPRFLPEFRRLVDVAPPNFSIAPLRFDDFAPRRYSDDAFDQRHADLAASVQTRLEEVILALAEWLFAKTRCVHLAMAGGVALNCVANARLAEEGQFKELWVQPAAGDAGTSLGAALYVARELGDTVAPMQTAALGRAWSDDEIEAALRTAKLRFSRSTDVAVDAARAVAANGIVAWFQGRSEFGPRALGHRSLLANPRPAENLDRLNAIKGREAFRPVAPMVTNRRAADIFEGVLPSPYMLFTHRVRPQWRERIAAAVHVDGSARIQTVDERQEPLVARMLDEVERLTGTPVVINTSFNTSGRPMVDSPRDALECFGSAPIDMLIMGSFAIDREGAFAAEPFAGAEALTA